MTNAHFECCLRCQGQRVIIGKFVKGMHLHTAAFRCSRPSGFWSNLADILNWRPVLISVPSESFLCLDCGTVWTSIDPNSAKSVLRLRADELLKKSLGLAEKTLSLEDELA